MGFGVLDTQGGSNFPNVVGPTLKTLEELAIEFETAVLVTHHVKTKSESLRGYAGYKLVGTCCVFGNSGNSRRYLIGVYLTSFL